MNNQQPSSLKAIIIGAGSIGERHAKNLLSMGITCSIFDIDEERKKHATLIKGLTVIPLITETTLREYDIACICTPTHTHIQLAREALESGCHLFIEKPLAVKSSPELDQLKKLAIASDRITLVGCNLRFHTALQELKKTIDSKELGKVYSAYLYFGQYLPFWRNIDYRKTYSARAEQGGGILLECIHEFDYLCWIFGEPQDIYAHSIKASDLEMNAEDLAEVIISFKTGLVAHLHLDCLQREKRRGYEVVGEKKTITWESINNKPEQTVIRKLSDLEITKNEMIIDPNTQYEDEMKYFITCVQEGKKSMNTIEKAAKMLELVEAAKISAQEKKIIRLNYSEEEK